MEKLISLFAILLVSQSTFAQAQSEIKTRIKGDLRIRQESIEAEGVSGHDNYDQLRLRARLSFLSHVNDQISTEVRLATGSGGTSTNQTLGDSTSTNTQNYDFKLDRAYAQYKPNDGLLARMGRTVNPYVLVANNSLLFDSDLNFDGLSAQYALQKGPLLYHVIAAHSILHESKGSNTSKDAFLDSLELAIQHDWSSSFILFTVSEHLFKGIKGNTSLVGSQFQGNSNDGTNFIKNYDVTSLGLEYHVGEFYLPMSFYAEWAQNNRVSKNNKASIYGIVLNHIKKRGDWMVSIDNREIQMDSTLGALTDTDSFGGGADGRSLNALVSYALEDSVTFTASYYNGQIQIAQGESKKTRNKFLLDLAVQF